MSVLDIWFGLMAGVLSCLTPETLLLFPLLLSAARADNRTSVFAVAAGVGLSLVLTGAVPGLFGTVVGFDSVWLRRIVCILLLLQGLLLMSESLVDRFPRLTGGVDSTYRMSGTHPLGGAFRLLLLALLVGANWLPTWGPALGKATLMAAGAQRSALALAVLFAFGVGAALPWIVLGRILRLFLRPRTGLVLRGMAGKRVLGLSLLAVAVLGGVGWDLAVVHWINPKLPRWASKLATRF
jgi:cytochrome c-type biogenesis protein